MLLTIDIGNTQVAAGVYEKEFLKMHWRFSSRRERTEDETWVLLQSLCAAHSLDFRQITGVAISSVVPDITRVFEKMAHSYLHMEAMTVSHELDLGMQIVYQNPASVGADRLCNAVGGIAKYGKPLIVVDLGTATTFDVVSASAEYLGGLIAPGIEASAILLHQRAARLPRVELKFPDRAIGHSTETCIQSGLLYGSVEMIDGMIERISRELGGTVNAVATGGLARLVIDRLRRVKEYDAFLTLDGLRLIYERNRKQ